VDSERQQRKIKYATYALHAKKKGYTRVRTYNHAPAHAHTCTHMHVHTRTRMNTHVLNRSRTHKHTHKYKIFITFPRQQWFRKGASMSLYTYIASHANFFLNSEEIIPQELNLRYFRRSFKLFYQSSPFLHSYDVDGSLSRNRSTFPLPTLQLYVSPHA
jgi:hypothetical protein